MSGRRIPAEPNPLLREGIPALLAHYGVEPRLQSLLTGAEPWDTWQGYNRDDVLELVLQEADQTALEPFVIAQALLEAGAPLENTDRFGMTRLYRLAARAHAQAVHWLLDRGASLAGCHDFGSPLHAVCWPSDYEGCGQLIERLVTLGVPLEARNHLGRTALHEAAEGGGANREAIRVLLALGADENPADRFGQTPLHRSG